MSETIEKAMAGSTRQQVQAGQRLPILAVVSLSLSLNTTISTLYLLEYLKLNHLKTAFDWLDLLSAMRPQVDASRIQLKVYVAGLVSAPHRLLMAVLDAVSNFFASLVDAFSSLVQAVYGLVYGLFQSAAGLIMSALRMLGGAGQFVLANSLVLILGAAVAFTFVRYTTQGRRLVSDVKRD
ncbi:hypothetical protein XA68_14648 [Ophiocordyceps unilateralis]|uniref:Uncharacterized protein n=1 Tax=Ophiocordyceps unilateralis TaxID=268505 RepID=A0A2A9PA38_OPHUN|nr:hypothetical protein XA68_14648 [Ophiocordyceps unilateralis]